VTQFTVAATSQDAVGRTAHLKSCDDPRDMVNTGRQPISLLGMCIWPQTGLFRECIIRQLG